MPAKERKDKSAIPRLVWTLTAVGVGAGVVILAIVNFALARVRDERARTESLQTRLTAAVAALREERKAVFADLQAHLSLDVGDDRAAARSPDSLIPMVRQCQECFSELASGGPTAAVATAELVRSFKSLSAIHEISEQWECETQQVHRDWNDARKRARMAIREATATAQKIEGRARLQRAAILRRYNRADKQEANALAVTIVDQLGSDRSLVTLKAELSDLALLCERLAAEREIDHLVSLKDNQIRQVLARLRRAAEKVGVGDDTPLLPQIEAVQEAVFGINSVDDVSHQTMIVGSGGLFSLQRRKLMVEKERRYLRTAVSENHVECLNAERALGDAVRDLAARAVGRVETTLREAWHSALLTGVALAAAFLLLARRISTLGRRTETQLRARNQESEVQRRQLEARSRDLRNANEVLEHANIAAEAATRSKTEFLANMSHEIRTPMTAILGFTETMLDPNQSDSEKLNAVHTVRRNGRHLLQIINDILDISKIEAGKLEIECIRCSPVQILSDVKSLMQVRADAKNLRLLTEYIGAIPQTIETDPTRLKQILVNLIGNAIKFTEVGGVRLITRFVDDGAEPKMQFDVIDTGLGMTPEQRRRLFQAFSQADSSTTRKFGGTGLGLMISKRLAEMLGGDITVESKIGEWSQFRITVTTGPLDGVKMLDDPAAAETAKPEEATADQPDVATLDCRILLAEDGPDNQRLISFLLKKAGAEVTIVENGKLAAGAALAARDEGDPFQVILMDMQMPIMDGYEAAGLLRQNGYTGPIIALTAHAMDSDRQKCINAGCDEYVPKPIDRNRLINVIQAMLNKTGDNTKDANDLIGVAASSEPAPQSRPP